MSLPPRLSETPSKEAIKKGLSRLCTHALRRYWILEPDGRVLLGLDCVRAHLKEGAPEHEGAAEEDIYAYALCDYLEDAVQRVESRGYRVILEIVLGLGDEQWKAKQWRHETASVRREEAGRKFRPEEGVVLGDTIRQHHEPRAIHALAKIVWVDETEARKPRQEHSVGS